MKMKLDSIILGILFYTSKRCNSLSLNPEGVETPEGDWVNPYDRASPEKLLCRDLLHKYHSLGLNGRPVVDMSKNITVRLALGLIQVDLDEKSRILTLSVWAYHVWVDKYLTWNLSEYNVGNIKLRSSDVWLPDIMLYNTADTDIPERSVHVLVNHLGHVIWIPHRIYRSSCSVDVSMFPFDRQECNLLFGSWTHHKTEIDLRLVPGRESIDLETFWNDYRDSCGWEITNSTGVRDDSAENIVLLFTLKMQRKRVFSTYILTMPCIFLASLTLVVFWLPPDRPDRTALGMSVFGSFLVLLLILVEAAPPTANSIPMLGWYYCFNMVIIMMSIILSTVVVNVSRGGDRGKVPRWIKVTMVDYLAKILMVNTHQFKYTTYRLCSSQQGTDVYSAPDSEQVTSPSDADVLTDLPNGNHFELKPTNYNTAFTFDNQSDSVFESASQVRLIRQGSSVTSYTASREKQTTAMEHFAAAMTKKMKNDNDKQTNNAEWKVVASVLDRLFFAIYVVLIVVSLSCLFPWPVWNV